MRKNIFYIIVLLFVSVAIIGYALLKLHLSKIHEWDDTYIKITNLYDRKQLCHVEDEYFFVKNNGVYAYGNDEPVIQTNKPLICSENDILYVYSDDIITGYTIDLKKTDEFKLVGDIMAFSVANEKIITFDTDRNLHIYNKNDMSEYNLPQESIKLDDGTLNYFEIDNMKIFEYEPDIINRDISDGEFIFENGEKIFEYRTKYAQSIPYVNEKYAIVNPRTNASGSLIKFDYKKSEEESLSLSEYRGNPIDYIHDNDTIISILSVVNISPHDNYFKEINNLKNHYKDIIVFINTDSMKIEKDFEVSKKERILFANKNIAVTFFKGECITYSLENWTKINSQKIEKIKKGGSYVFQVCGDYIFVFDDNTGELINRISIDF